MIAWRLNENAHCATNTAECCPGAGGRRRVVTTLAHLVDYTVPELQLLAGGPLGAQLTRESLSDSVLTRRAPLSE